MPKNKRLSHAEFARVIKKSPQRSSGAYGTMAAYPLLGLATGPKFAITVLKKDFPKSVTRNLVSRRCWGILRPLVHCVDPRYAYVVRLKKGADTTMFTELKESISRLFERFNSRDTIR